MISGYGAFHYEIQLTFDDIGKHACEGIWDDCALKKNDIRMGIGLCNTKGISTIMGCSGWEFGAEEVACCLVVEEVACWELDYGGGGVTTKFGWAICIVRSVLSSWGCLSASTNFKYSKKGDDVWVWLFSCIEEWKWCWLLSWEGNCST